MTATQVDKSVDHFRSGLLFAVLSAITFGLSGPFAKALMEAGWTPTAAVTARMAGGAIAMALVATFMRPGWIREAVQHARTVVVYGIVPVAGAQLFYFNAVEHLSVGVALLLEYTAPILVVGYVWITTRRRPTNLTFAGVAMAIAGIMLVLNVFAGAHLNGVGVVWGLSAAVCAACYYVMSDNVSADGGEGSLNAITLATGGLIVGAVVTTLVGVTGVMPFRFTTNDTVVAGFTVSWLVPVIALAVIPTAIAYTLGIMGIARLQPRFASLVGLSEVMFAVLAAWILLGEAITPAQAVGGAVVLIGLTLARQGDRSEELVEAACSDGPVKAAESEQRVSRT